MSVTDIKHGYCVVRLLMGSEPTSSAPIGVAAWDQDREWWGLRLLTGSEAPSRIPRKRLNLAMLAERDVNHWASKGRVPNASGRVDPWQPTFWSTVHRMWRSAIRVDPPVAMQPMADADKQFDLLFEALAAPRTTKERAPRADSQLNVALGDELLSVLSSNLRIRAFHDREERAKKGAEGPGGSVIIEAVNLASAGGRDAADALVSRLDRIREGQDRPVEAIIGYLASPGGLNGESDMKAWLKHRITDDVYDLIEEVPRLRDAARLALGRLGVLQQRNLDEER